MSERYKGVDKEASKRAVSAVFTNKSGVDNDAAAEPTGGRDG